MLAQNLQPMRQPTCVETHCVLPYLYFIRTPSIMLPSARRKRYFSVPSAEMSVLTTSMAQSSNCSESFALKALGSAGISEMLCPRIMPL